VENTLPVFGNSFPMRALLDPKCRGPPISGSSPCPARRHACRCFVLTGQRRPGNGVLANRAQARASHGRAARPHRQKTPVEAIEGLHFAWIGQRRSVFRYLTPETPAGDAAEMESGSAHWSPRRLARRTHLLSIFRGALKIGSPPARCAQWRIDRNC
jgi:hypothetical protein